jgi:peptide/nickel transport system permease protein
VTTLEPVDALALGPVVGTEPADGTLKRGLGIMFWVSIGWVVLLSLAALLAPWLPIRGAEERKILPPPEFPPYSPRGDFWFGSDTLTRDIFARTIHGARVSLVVGFAAIAFGMLVGGSLGIIAGYFRGWADKIISFVFIVALSFPSLVLAILITSLIDRSLFTVSATLGVLAIAPVGRLARATTIQYADREFVVAARTIGASHTRIIVRELLPNVVIPMGALGLLGMAVAIVAEGSLAFLGLSVEEGVTWGRVIVDGAGSSELRSAPWMALSPILMLFLTVLALNYCGDRLRAYFDVKEVSL